MNKQIFLNLPVADLAKSKAFFQALGYSLNPQFSGEGGACVVISETISVMLATHPKFRELPPRRSAIRTTYLKCLHGSEMHRGLPCPHLGLAQTRGGRAQTTVLPPTFFLE